MVVTAGRLDWWAVPWTRTCRDGHSFDLDYRLCLELEMDGSCHRHGARNFAKIKEAVAATDLKAILSALVMLMGFFGLYPLLQHETVEILPQLRVHLHDCYLCRG